MHRSEARQYAVMTTSIFWLLRRPVESAAYHYLDLTPMGRHEEGLPYSMDWVRLRDQYKPTTATTACCQN